MSLRPAPKTSQHVVALDYEIAQEQASALGRLGRALEAALAALTEYDRTHHDDCLHRDGSMHRKPAVKRARLVQEAADALWCFMVQREACGLCDPRPVFSDYRVPAEVQNRMGAFVGPRRTNSA